MSLVQDVLGAGLPAAESAEYSVSVGIRTAFFPLLRNETTQRLSWVFGFWFCFFFFFELGFLSSLGWLYTLQLQRWRLVIPEFGRRGQANHPGLLDKFEAAERASFRKEREGSECGTGKMAQPVRALLFRRF